MIGGRPTRCAARAKRPSGWAIEVVVFDEPITGEARVAALDWLDG